MNQRSLAISILQKARDVLTEQLTERVIESRRDIEADAAGASYMSEIETLYEQLGGRLAHLNAMLANLPPDSTPTSADTAASEIVYADLASTPGPTLDLEPLAPLTLLALPAPIDYEPPQAEPLVERFANVVLACRSGEWIAAGSLIGEIFDLRPSVAHRAARAFGGQLRQQPDLGRRLEHLGSALSETNDYAVATLLVECFEFQAIDALSVARGLKDRQTHPDWND